MKNSKKIAKKKLAGIPAIHTQVAGIDIGATLIHVAAPELKTNKIITREFGTTTPELLKISTWLKTLKIEKVAMEATGVYWIPLFETLEDAGFDCALVDPKNVKNVPGRKTDFKDAQWIQKLHSCALLNKAYRPPKEKLLLRTYVRHRDNIVQDRAKQISRMIKTLALMNLRLDVVVANVTCVTGMKIIRAIAGGERDPQRLALLRDRSCKKTPEEFVAALTGNYQPSHLFALCQTLEIYDYYESVLKECDLKIEKELQSWPTVTNEELPPKKDDRSSRKNYQNNAFSFDLRSLLYKKTGADLTSLSGISEQSALVIISELGDFRLSSFSTVKKWASWLGLCPGNNISGGKSHRGKAPKRLNRIKQALQVGSMTLHHAKSEAGAYYRRLRRRLDAPKAIKAAAHRTCRLIYMMLKRGQSFVEKGEKAYEERAKVSRLHALKKQARKLGFELKELEKCI